LARAFRNARTMMDVKFATTWEASCGVAGYSRSLVAELEKHARIEVVSLDPGSVTSPASLAARLNQGDVVHIQHQYPFFGGMALHRNWFNRVLGRLKRPPVVTVHELDLGDSDSPPMRAYKRWFNKRLFAARQIGRIVVHTSEYRDRLTGLGIEPSRIRVIPMWVPSITQSDVSPDAAKSELGLAGKKVVTIFGFVVRRKGYDLALEALRRWPEDVTLLIAGGPHPGDRTGFFDTLKDRIAAEGLSARVVITGYLPEDRVPLVMAAADVIAAPFTMMSSSWSMMHAIAYRKPIVASDLPPMREMNERTPCLTLFNPGDSGDFAAKVIELLKDGDEMRRAVAAVDSYAQTWTAARAAADTMAAYREVQSTKTETEQP